MKFYSSVGLWFVRVVSVSIGRGIGDEVNIGVVNKFEEVLKLEVGGKVVPINMSKITWMWILMAF